MKLVNEFAIVGPDYQVFTVQMENGDILPDVGTTVIFCSKPWRVVQFRRTGEGLIEFYTTPAEDVFSETTQMMKNNPFNGIFG